MEVTKSTCMITIIVLLSIVCAGLIIGLATPRQKSESESETRTLIGEEGPKSFDKISLTSQQDENHRPYSETNLSDDENPEVVLEVGRVPPISPSLPWETDIRLPRTVLPLHYDLRLFPHLNEGVFTGNVSILVNSLEVRNHFTVHSKYLTIDEVTVIQESTSQAVELLTVIEHEENEFLVVRTKGNVDAGNFTISIGFSGNLTRGLVGFYRAFYTDAKGGRIPIATSKFQPTFARRAFPCFDEPSFKSTFSISLIRPSNGGYIALSNMPVKREVPNWPIQGFTEVKFEKSVPMVTYLACFIVCNFEYEEKITQIHSTVFRVYSTPGQRSRVQYALDIGANMTDFYENYFQIAYPLPKQDMIAIPDFASGAMEHWGLITYRETNLLFDERESSSANQQRVATVVSHELAHQWFGNLVTLSWWDDLWLNEGFASYIEYKGVANFHRDWEMDAQFLYELQSVMDLDSTVNSHPIVQTVEHPDQITEIFDRITYSKGASVLRMLENFMGTKEFKVGITSFLDKYKYGNAVTSDFWKELEGASSKHLDITHIMDRWTRQMGYPLITVQRVKEDVVRVSQSRFLLDSSKAGQGLDSPFHYKWDVHITYSTSVKPSSVDEKWLASSEDSLDITLPSGTTWVKFNVGQKGYYRVNYPENDWKNFVQLLHTGNDVLGPSDRANLINDAFSLADAGHIDYSIPLSILSYLKFEEHRVPWWTAYRHLSKLERLLSSSHSYHLFRKFVKALVDDRYNELGWRDDGTHLEKRNRIDILKLACSNGHSECLREASNSFAAWIEDQSRSVYVPPNLRSLTYEYGMMSQNAEEHWNILLDRYMSEQNAQEKRKLVKGLVSVDQPWILMRALELAKNETIVRRQDYIIFLIEMSRNDVGSPIVWNFVRDQWPYLVDRFSLNDRNLGRLPKYVSSSFNTQLKLDEMKEFFAKHPEAGAGKRAREQAVEHIENNIKWLKDNHATVKSWLESNV